MPPTPVLKVRVRAVVLGAAWDTKPLAACLKDVNVLYQPAGVAFEFDPAADTEFESTDLFLTDPSGVAATKRALQYRGALVIFFTDRDLGPFSGPGEYVHLPRGVIGDHGKVAHEIGHYFLLYHTFVEGLKLPVVAERIRSAVEADPVVAQALGSGGGVPAEPTGQIASQVMAEEMDGDNKPGIVFPVADTPAAIHELPPGYNDACLPGLSFDFDVTFSNGETRTFAFVPDQANLMGYAHSCENLPRYFSHQQIDIARASLRMGSRSHIARGSLWHSLEDQPGPAAAAWTKGHLDLFARFPDGTVRLKSWDQARDGWWPNDVDWFNLGGGYGIWPPAAVSWGPGRVDVFAIFGDGDVWMKSWDKSTSKWSPSDQGWFPLGGKAFGPMSVVSWGKNHLDLFARFADGTIRSKVWHEAGDGWWPGDLDWFPLLTPAQLS